MQVHRSMLQNINLIMTAVIQATTMARSRLVPVTERMESKIHMVHMMEKH